MHACSFVLDRNDFERARVTKFMNFPVIERNFEGKSMATLDCAHARSFVARGSLVFRQRGGGRGFFFFGGGNVPAFRTPVFSRVIRLIMFYYRVERFVRSNYFKIREWKIDEIEAIFTPGSPRPLLRLGVDIKL